MTILALEFRGSICGGDVHISSTSCRRCSSDNLPIQQDSVTQVHIAVRSATREDSDKRAAISDLSAINRAMLTASLRPVLSRSASAASLLASREGRVIATSIIRAFFSTRHYATTRPLQQASMAFDSPLVGAEELKEALQAFPDSIRCVDASWHLGGGRDARKEYAEDHLPGAVFFDIDDVADKDLPLPHMIPSEEVFSSKVSDMGISSDHTIIVYASAGSFSAPRCWWTFRTFGHESVHVLDGGLPAWTEAGGALEHGVPERKSTRPSPGLVQSSGNAWKLRDKGFRARLNAPMLRTWRQVLNQSEQGKLVAGQVVDARSLARFRAEAPEPRAGVAGGHVPGSICVPFNSVLLEGNVNRFRSPSEIRKVFEEAGVDIESPLPITTTCGSGVTASVLTFALELAGRKAYMSPVYDGSWAEWGSRDDLPKAKGKDLD